MSSSDPIENFNERAKTNGWPMRFEYARSFQNGRLNTLLDVWKTKSVAEIPSRSDFDARTMKPFLPNLAIVERVGAIGTRRYRFRLIGTALAELFGDATGKFLEDALPNLFVERWAAGYDAVLEAGRPIRVSSHFELPEVNYLDGETLMAPLLSGDKSLNTVMAVTYVEARRGL